MSTHRTKRNDLKSRLAEAKATYALVRAIGMTPAGKSPVHRDPYIGMIPAERFAPGLIIEVAGPLARKVATLIRVLFPASHTPRITQSRGSLPANGQTRIVLRGPGRSGKTCTHHWLKAYLERDGERVLVSDGDDTQPARLKFAARVALLNPTVRIHVAH